MKRTITTIALVCAASAFTAFAQDIAQDKDSTTTAPEAPKHEGRPHFGGQGGPGGGPMREAMESLTPAERTQLMEARKKAMESPEVKNAEKALRDAVHAAMLKADPTIGPVLEKVEAAMKEKHAEHKEHQKPATP